MRAFGFFGRYQESYSWSAPGRTSGTARIFAVTHGAWRKREQCVLHFIFQGPPPNPDTQLLLIPTVPYDGNARAFFYESETIATTFDQDLISSYCYQGTASRAFTHTVGDGVNRNMKIIFHRPDLVRGFALSASGASASGNAFAGVLRVPYLINVESIRGTQSSVSSNGANITSITGVWPPYVKAIHLAQSTYLTSIEKKFPKSLKYLELAATSSLGPSINSLIAECINMEMLNFGAAVYSDVGPSGGLFLGAINLQISHMSNIKVFNIGGATTMTNITFANFTGVRRFQLTAATAMNQTTLKAIFNDVFTSPVLKIFNGRGSNLVWARSFTNADFATTLIDFYFHANLITGSISLTTAKPSLANFMIGDNGALLGDASKNNFATVDVSGLTNATLIDLSNSQIVNLTLPVNTVCTILGLGGNNLSVTTNPSLVSQINAMTGLTALYFHAGSSTSSTADNGQDSIDGFGNNLSLSGLTALTILYANRAKMTGTLTLPASLSILIIRDNNLSGIAGAGIALRQIQIVGNTLFNNNFTATPNIITITLHDSAVTTFDLSGKTTTDNYTTITIANNPSITSISLPSIAARCIFNINFTFVVSNNPLLSTINNIENINYPQLNTGATRGFHAQGCALNTDLKIGVNGWLPCQIQLQDNGMSQANVDINVNNIYVNKTKWSTSLASKSLLIGGTNAAPSGIEQPPTGFVLGSADGTPASAKEQIYVLENNYGWTITNN